MKHRRLVINAVLLAAAMLGQIADRSPAADEHPLGKGERTWSSSSPAR